MITHLVEARSASYSYNNSGYFYSASSSPLLLRGAPDTARIVSDTVPEFHAEGIWREGLAKGSYVAARAGVEPMTLRAKGVDSTNVPPMPHILYLQRVLY